MCLSTFPAFQINYAALDAYCMLMLYQVCARWGARIGVNVEELAYNQERIRIPLPLFFDRSKLKSEQRRQELISTAWDNVDA